MMQASDGVHWSLPQVLDWLTKAGPGGIPLCKDQRSALRAILDNLVAKKIRVRGHSCAWNDGHLEREDEYRLASAEGLSNAEFISGPDGGEWFLVPWGSEPFAKPKPKPGVSRPGSLQAPGGGAMARYKYDQSGNCVEVPLGQIDGLCELEFQRDEVMALWPEPENSTTEGGGMEVPTRKRGTPSQDNAAAALTAVYGENWPSSVSKDVLRRVNEWLQQCTIAG
jgi:hypothetical protein